VAGLVELLIEGMLDFPVPLRRNAGFDISGGQRLSELVAVVALVGNQGVC